MAFDFGFYYSHCIGDAVDAGLVDGVAKELVAVFDRNVSEIDGVAGAVGKVAARYIDGVVLQLVDIEGVAGHLLCWLRKEAMGGTACQHED